MKTSTILSFAAVALTTPTLALDLSGLPKCAQTCAISGVTGSSCALTDIACICATPAFLTSFTSCVQKSCSTADQTTASTFGVSYCASAGVSISTSATSGTATNTAAASSASSAVSSAAAAAAATTSSSLSISFSSSNASAATTSHSNSTSSTASPSVATHTGGAGAVQASGAVMAGLVMVGVLGFA